MNARDIFENYDALVAAGATPAQAMTEGNLDFTNDHANFVLNVGPTLILNLILLQIEYSIEAAQEIITSTITASTGLLLIPAFAPVIHCLLLLVPF